MVGLEREGVRVQAAKQREEAAKKSQGGRVVAAKKVEDAEEHTTNEEEGGKKYDVGVGFASATILCPSAEAKPDSDVDMSSGGLSHDSHVSDDWVAQLKACLPEEICTSCKLTLGLNVDDSPQTVAKLLHLLDCLESKCI